jgi:hypothetical protein
VEGNVQRHIDEFLVPFAASIGANADLGRNLDRNRPVDVLGAHAHVDGKPHPLIKGAELERSDPGHLNATTLDQGVLLHRSLGHSSS